MKKILILASLIFVAFVFTTAAQDRKSVGAAEVTGTFRNYFAGEFKDSYNEINILALGGGKLRMSFKLIYPFVTSTGEVSANVGEANGTARIERDQAFFVADDNAECRVSIKFVKPGIIEIIQDGANSDCAFGLNVNAGGTYKKSSDEIPVFEH